MTGSSALEPRDPADVLAELDRLRAADAPTHGGRLLAYVYDPGMAALDEVASRAAAAVQSLNGLDPTTFPSVAALERDLVSAARQVLAGGSTDVVGSVTSGGTESCLLAVKAARDGWRARTGSDRRPVLVVGSTAHPAFRKAADYLDLTLRVLPVDAVSCAVRADDVAAVLASGTGPDVALIVVSAPSYPHGVLDPVEQVAALCSASGVACHVDACIGGWVLPWWPVPAGDGEVAAPRWDLTVPGVSSLSVDLHKYGYAPKGASLLLHADRDGHRRQYFATTRWPGYSVVNPTALGSRSVMPLAAAWAVMRTLGDDGFRELTARTARAATALRAWVDGGEGLRVVGESTGPLLAVATDAGVPAGRRVDPHRWADAARALGWVLQPQPGLAQDDGTALPATTHLTVTPVTEAALPELLPALTAAADTVRGTPAAAADPGLLALAGSVDAAALDSDAAAGLLVAAGLDPAGGLPAETAPLLALLEQLPAPLAERLLVEFLARFTEPG